MPRLCDDFNGIAVRMYPYDNLEHHEPHFHAEYAEHEVVFRIPDFVVLTGSLPPKKLKLILEWAILRKAQLQSCWDKAVVGLNPGTITEPDAPNS